MYKSLMILEMYGNDFPSFILTYDFYSTIYVKLIPLCLDVLSTTKNVSILFGWMVFPE